MGIQRVLSIAGAKSVRCYRITGTQLFVMVVNEPMLMKIGFKISLGIGLNNTGRECLILI